MELQVEGGVAIIEGREHRAALGTIAEVAASSVLECAQRCDSEGSCVAFTFGEKEGQPYTGKCYLKSEVGTAVEDDCCSSGLKCAAQHGLVKLDDTLPDTSALQHACWQQARHTPSRCVQFRPTGL